MKLLLIVRRRNVKWYCALYQLCFPGCNYKWKTSHVQLYRFRAQTTL